jgi:hypothetical protein
MNKYFIAIFILILTPFLGFTQNLLVANNNPGAAPGVNVFTGVDALRDAIAAASANDIIYVVPGSTSYGDIAITKPLTIYGAGLQPDSDLGARSIIDMIEIDASDVRISGIRNTTDEVRLGSYSSGNNLNGIIIENSRVARIMMISTTTATLSNLLIRNNIITGNGSLATHILLYDLTSNTVVTNNILLEGAIGFQPMIRGNDIIYQYNLFADNSDENAFRTTSVNCLFDHNIFYNVNVNNPTTNCTFNNNLAWYPTDDALSTFNLIDNGTTGTGNISSVGGSNDPLFVNFPITQTWNDAYDVTLQSGSPALNVNGEDIGPSGGPTPFDSEGNILPLIQSLTIPSVIPAGSDLPITIKAKGN